MSKLSIVKVEDAQGKTAELYQSIKKEMGTVPNIFLAVGTNANALQTFLGIGAGLKAGLLTPAEREAISLSVAQRNNCNYCLAAHTLLGKMSGLSPEEMIHNRQGSSEDKKRAALVSLVQEIVEKRGNISDKTLNAFRDAGYTDSHVPEVLLSVVQNIYTNYFNNLNGTDIDFPAAPAL